MIVGWHGDWHNYLLTFCIRNVQNLITSLTMYNMYMLLLSTVFDKTILFCSHLNHFFSTSQVEGSCLRVPFHHS